MQTTLRLSAKRAKPSSDPPPPLRLLFWETTTGCNLECVHCRRLEVSQQLSKNDLNTQQSLKLIRTLPQTGKPIIVFSGGEPLMRKDIFELAAEASSLGLPTALATNGTMIDDRIAQQIVDVRFQRVAISFDGANAQSHDKFRGTKGAFDDSIRGFKTLHRLGVSMQINTTVTQHNCDQLDQIYKLALDLHADALHIFMLVPVGCGMTMPEDVRLTGQKYEKALHWIYDRSQENKIHLKATCAPHYFRVLRQRARQEGRHIPTNAPVHHHCPGPATHAHPKGHPGGGHPGSKHPGSGHPGAHLSAMTKGCLAGQAVCFVSHTGEVFPCGYLPISSGNVTQTPLPDIWRHSSIFANMRSTDKLQGKCGGCEYKKVCMGCRARAYAQTGNYMDEEPNCDYQPVSWQTHGAS